MAHVNDRSFCFHLFFLHCPFQTRNESLETSWPRLAGTPFLSVRAYSIRRWCGGTVVGRCGQSNGLLSGAMLDSPLTEERRESGERERAAMGKKEKRGERRKREGRGRDEKRDERREEKSEVGREREREKREVREEREREKRQEREERERERKRGEEREGEG